MNELQTIKSGISIGKMFKIIVWSFFIILLFAKPFLVLYTTHDLGLASFEIGKQFFLTTQALNDEVKSIMLEGNIYNFTNKWEGFKNVFFHYSSLISSLGLIFLWLSIIMNIMNKISYQNSWLFRFSMALLMFYFVQVLFILGYAGLTNNIKGLVGNNSISEYLSMPILCFINLVKIIPLLISPLEYLARKVDTVGTILNASNNINIS